MLNVKGNARVILTKVRILATLSLLAITCPSFGQDIVYKFEADFKKAANLEGIKDDDYFVVAGQQKPDRYGIYFTNPSRDLNIQYGLPSSGGKILGFSANGKELSVYFELNRSEYPSRIECLTLSKVINKVIDKGELSYQGEKFISLLKQDSMLFMLSSKKDSLILSRIERRIQKKDRVSFFIPDKRLVAYFKKEQFEFIPDGYEISYDKAMNQNKIYFSDKKILIVDDRKKKVSTAETNIIELDTELKSLTIRTLTLPYDKKVSHNSFLFKEHLFILGIEKSRLGLQVYDVNDLTKEKEYFYSNREPIQFKNSDLISDNKNMDKDWQIYHRTQSEITQLTLNELNTGKIPVISVTGVGEDHRLLIASVNILGTGGGSGGAMIPMGGGGPISTPGGTVSMPMNYSYSPGAYFKGGEQSIEKSQFYGYLTKDFSLVPNGTYTEHGLFSKHEKRIIELNNKFKLAGLGTINSPEGPYLLYLLKNDEVLKIEKFN